MGAFMLSLASWLFLIGFPSLGEFVLQMGTLVFNAQEKILADDVRAFGDGTPFLEIVKDRLDIEEWDFRYSEKLL